MKTNNLDRCNEPGRQNSYDTMFCRDKLGQKKKRMFRSEYWFREPIWSAK